MIDLLASYEDFARGSTDAPTKYHRYCGAVLVGTVMGRRFWYQHGHRQLFPASWVCLIGPSGVKKTTSLGIVEDLLADVNPELALPSKFSWEKLLMEVAKTPAGILTYGELHSFLALLGRDFNAEAKSGLADWWDSPAVRTYATKGMARSGNGDAGGDGRVVLRRPAVSILSGTTLSWFTEAARSKDVSGGFYARMLFTVAEKSDVPPMILPPPRDEAKADAIKEGLRSILDVTAYEMHESGRMDLSPAAKRDYETVYLDLLKTYGRSDVLGPFAIRGQVYILKLAMVSAMARRRSRTAEPDDVEFGTALVRASMRDIEETVTLEIADTKTERYLNTYRAMLRKAGPQGMTKRSLFKGGPVKDPDYFENKLFKMLLANDFARAVPGRREDSIIVVSLEKPLNGEQVTQ